MVPTYFSSPGEWRAWLARHHASATEIWVGFHKVGTGRPSLTWPQSVDEALCYGWIDGIRKRVDDERYVIRFTPRKPTSTWSAVNIRRVAELEALGHMREPGRKAFAARREERSATYSYERRPTAFGEPYAKAFQKHRAAWTFFEAQPAGYRGTAIAWVMSAKQEATRERRLAQLIQDSAQKKRLSLLARTNGSSA
ncbi:MAG TPA: YdeI/OmpD-associated family protein [Gemmatimonadaceae bacterium]|nr:MAG: bacteriocin-protection protein [Gemmatimonadetes bacterium SCN 70-22]HMN07672.1 YdeI/OmpD-associated family protein [Gemmatimonadaceae bacterium]